MKKLVQLLLFACGSSLPALADDGDVFYADDYEVEVVSEAESTVNIRKYTGSAFVITIPTYVRNEAGKNYTVEYVSRDAASQDDGAFAPSKITEVRFGDTVKEIGDYAFYRCYNLQSVEFGAGLTRISYMAFSQCTSLSSVTLPKSVTGISTFAFLLCTSLEHIYVEEGNPAFRSNADGVVYSLDMKTFKIAPPATVSYAVPEGTESIGTQAFSRCVNLVSVTLPESLTSIGDYAFSYATSLVTVVMKGATPPALGKTPFTNIPESAILYVPEGCAETYRAAEGWNTFSKILEGDGVTAAEGECFSSDDFIFRVESTADRTLDLVHYEGNGGEVTIPQTVMCNGEMYTVTSIGKNKYVGAPELGMGTYAFLNCTDVTYVHMPPTIKHIGYSAFEGCSALTGIYVSETLETIETSAFKGCSALAKIWLPTTLTSIGNFAFYGCSALTSLSIPDTVETIGWNAFAECSSLRTVTLPESLELINSELFNGCSALTSVNIPSEVKTIIASAFYRCPALKRFTVDAANTHFKAYDGAIFSYDMTQLVRVPGGYTYFAVPEMVTHIGDNAFLDCESLVTLSLPSTLTHIGNSAFSCCFALPAISLPSGLESVEARAFSYCRSLEAVSLPAGVKQIGESTFAGCESLKTVSLGSAIDYLGDNAFKGCAKLEAITLPEALTDIGAGCFEGCSSLASVNIPKGLTIFRDNLFYGCKSLTKVDFPENLTKIGNKTFQGSAIAEAIIPEKVTEIGEFAFGSCADLKNAVVPEGVKVLSRGCFNNCTALTDLNLPEGLEEIGSWALGGCTSLAEVKLPSTLNTLSNSAMAWCTAMRTIICPAVTPPHDLVNNAFRDIPADAVTVYVPAASLDLYRNDAGWNYFSNFRPIESGVELPELDASDAEAEYYDLNGRRVDASRLNRGVYIMRRGGVTSKVIR